MKSKIQIISKTMILTAMVIASSMSFAKTHSVDISPLINSKFSEGLKKFVTSTDSCQKLGQIASLENEASREFAVLDEVRSQLTSEEARTAINNYIIELYRCYQALEEKSAQCISTDQKISNEAKIRLQNFENSNR
ncbi:MAG: hypothetical protein ACXVLQ_17230 [Bacteriovorax sp.]